MIYSGCAIVPCAKARSRLLYQLASARFAHQRDRTRRTRRSRRILRPPPLPLQQPRCCDAADGHHRQANAGAHARNRSTPADRMVRRLPRRRENGSENQIVDAACASAARLARECTERPMTNPRAHGAGAARGTPSRAGGRHQQTQPARCPRARSRRHGLCDRRLRRGYGRSTRAARESGSRGSRI